MMKELSRQIQAVVPGSPHTAGVCVLLGEGEGLDPSNHATCSWMHKSCEIWENDDKMKVASETNLSDSAAPWVWCWKRHYVLFNPPAPLSIHVRILQVTVGVLHHPSPKYEHISGAWFPPRDNIPAAFSRHCLKVMKKNINLHQSSCVKKTSFLLVKNILLVFLRDKKLMLFFLSGSAVSLSGLESAEKAETVSHLFAQRVFLTEHLILLHLCLCLYVVNVFHVLFLCVRLWPVSVFCVPSNSFIQQPQTNQEFLQPQKHRWVPRRNIQSQNTHGQTHTHTHTNI